MYFDFDKRLAGQHMGIINPTDVKVYVEKGVPYLDYTGEFMTNEGTHCKIHVPKISLTFTSIDCSQDTDWCFDSLGQRRQLKTNFQCCVDNDDKIFAVEILEREVSKETLEKELGYRLKFTDEGKVNGN